MSVPSDYEWELSRENIRPLREGRSVRSLNSAFGGGSTSMHEAQVKFEEAIKEAEKAEDALDVCLKYISWFEETFPTGKRSHLYQILVRIVNTFGNCERYRNDTRMMKIWFKLAENSLGISADVFFERAYTAGCCRKLAQFYVRWAELREACGDINGARIILSRGKENDSEPGTLLIEAVDALEMRQLRLLQEESGGFDTEDSEPQRIALGGLECPLSTPVFRDSHSVAYGITRGEQQMRRPHTESCNFQVFQDDESFDTSGLLVPQYFGEDLGRVDFIENRKDPTKWKDTRINMVKKSSGSISCSFEVFNEEEYRKKQKEKRARDLALSMLLATNETVSAEELLAKTKTSKE